MKRILVLALLAALRGGSSGRGAWRRILRSRPLGRPLGVLALLAVFAGRAGAGETARTAGATAVRMPVGGRAAGMGNAHAALAVDAYAPFYNPGALGRVAAPEIALQHVESILDVEQQYLGYVLPRRSGVFSFAWQRLDHGRFDRTEILTGTSFARLGTFDAASNAWSVGYGGDLGGLAVGVQGKLIREEIAEFDAVAAALDAGVHWRRADDRLSFGVAVQNLGTRLEFVARRERLPILVRAGAAWRSPGGRLVLALDVEKALDSEIVVRGGGEYWVIDSFALRLGVDSSSDVGRNLTVGVGYRRSRIALDYAYASEGVLGGVHRLSLGYRWDERPAAAEAPVSSTQPASSTRPPALTPAIRLEEPPAETPAASVLVLDLRGPAGPAYSDALAAALEARGLRVHRSATARPDDPHLPRHIVSGTVGRTGYASLLLEETPSHRYEHFAVSALDAPNAEAFGAAAADLLLPRLR